MINIKKEQSLTSNLFGFMRYPLIINNYITYKNFDTLIMGIPCDITCSGKSGCKLAPNNIREASGNLIWEKKKWPWNFNLNKILKIADIGDLIYEFGNINDLNKQIDIILLEILKKKKKLIIFGGDHYITLPILKTYKKIYKEISLIHFDAHTDTYPNKNIFDHGSVFYQAEKKNLIKKENTIQLGIRTYINKENKFKIITSEEINKTKTNKIIKIIEKITKKKPTYLTFDIDCLDPSYAPGTGTPVIGGINTNKILKIIRKLKNINLIGIDIVEVSPPYDISNITSLTAATIALELLYVQAYYKKKNMRINNE